jgi:hypothetical protein
MGNDWRVGAGGDRKMGVGKCFLGRGIFRLTGRLAPFRFGTRGMGGLFLPTWRREGTHRGWGISCWRTI